MVYSYHTKLTNGCLLLGSTIFNLRNVYAEEYDLLTTLCSCKWAKYIVGNIPVSFVSQI